VSGGKVADLVRVRAGFAALGVLAREHPELTAPAAQARLGRYLGDLTREEERTMTGKPREGRALTANLGIRMSPADLARLDALAQRIPFVSRHGVARAALRLGMAQLEENPARILDAGPTDGEEAPAGKRARRPPRR
jgi:hypothetical protein